ncbi:uncharacterized protein MONOS_10709 [Monocercomonoides exilis]|uniref:uncharacterized protein n=1 Tax=Monocercomonoides exilis TaxID=2049356 RepID=UPI00355A8D77|nr:hypothetical protein MONOS_10709 [Monocercomonoides exilis]|eukprot:MONOS_10709.1-p1 / transcript=MONOS_10709.1 / gene=MONOS_10709 / organism=Monocercomonoides_exilis_PA203 / gene_product=unspecified product / transcript_product=unspecified product / location=Mono_scaffold00497:21490-22346(+) / protein_length=258 / sequence_SO=supercontig / SO=protein_coding / is_pseudo=false
MQSSDAELIIGIPAEKTQNAETLKKSSAEDKQPAAKTVSPFEGASSSSSVCTSPCPITYYQSKSKHSPLSKNKMEYEVSIMQAPDAWIEVVSQHVCVLLAVALPNLINSKRHHNAGKEKIVIELSDEGLDMHGKVQHFYRYIRDGTKLTTGELVHSYVLLEHLMRAESKELSEGRQTMIAESNLGTLLLCVVMIAIKLDRDVPFRNGWWAAMFKVPLDVLNQSEVIFLERVNHHTFLEETDYKALFHKFTSSLRIQRC